MASNSETGHDKNIANAETMILIYTGWGGNYAPGTASIKLPQLVAKHLAAKTKNKDFNDLDAPLKVIEDARRVKYEPLDEVVRGCMGIYESSDAGDGLIKNARRLVDLITGDNVSKHSKKKGKGGGTAEGGEGDLNGGTNGGAVDDAAGQGVSVSQQSFDKRLEHLYQFKQLLAADSANYAPVEANRTVAFLDGLYDSLDTANTAVKAAKIPVDEAADARDLELYEPELGLVDLMLRSKKYVKGLGDAKYNAVKGIKFTKPEKED